MQYLLLLYFDENSQPDPNSDEMKKTLGRYQAAVKTLQERGQFVAGDALKSVDRATTVRVRDGETLLTDGPFAETREQLGGYFLIECDTLDEAVEAAKLIPASEHGSVEIRPIHIH